MGPRWFWRAALSSTVMLLGLSAGCQLIFQFDRTKIEGDGGAGGDAVTGGGGTTSTSTTTSSTTTDGCMKDDDCPAPLEDCQIAKCDTVTGMCGQKAVMNGTAAMLQTAEDCKKNVCTGGVVTEVGDPNDVYNDGNDCTDDICDANNDPVSAPSAAGTACNVNGGKLCDGAGACVECLMDTDCTDPAKPLCSAGNACVPKLCMNGVKDGDETDVDCGGTCGACTVGKQCGNLDNNCVGTAYCDAGICAAKKNNGTGCIGANECTSGFCADAVCCDTACAGTCKACSAAKKGGANGTCANVTTGQDPDNECAGSLTCTSGACSPKLADGASCTVDGECTNNHCVDGVCCDNACGGTCQACSAAKKGQGSNGTCGTIVTGQDPDDECNGNGGTDVCIDAGSCRAVLGSSCVTGTECVSEFCVDGFCCDTSCSGQCQTCNLDVWTKGTCKPIPAGSDPANECNGGGTLDLCNGGSGCGLGAPGATCVPNAVGVCTNGNCTAGGMCL